MNTHEDSSVHVWTQTGTRSTRIGPPLPRHCAGKTMGSSQSGTSRKWRGRSRIPLRRCLRESSRLSQVSDSEVLRKRKNLYWDGWDGRDWRQPCLSLPSEKAHIGRQPYSSWFHRPHLRLTAPPSCHPRGQSWIRRGVRRSSCSASRGSSRSRRGNSAGPSGHELF